MEDYKTIAINNCLDFIKNESSVQLPYELDADMFYSVGEFINYFQFVISRIVPHMMIQDRSDQPYSPELDHSFIKCGDYTYYHIFDNRNALLHTHLNEYGSMISGDKFVFSMYAITDIFIAFIYLSPFLPDGFKLDSNGYRFSIKGDVLTSTNGYCAYKRRGKRPGPIREASSLVILSNNLTALLLAELFPNAMVYSPVPVLYTEVQIIFDDVVYYIRFNVDNPPPNIIFGNPPRKYWPKKDVN